MPNSTCRSCGRDIIWTETERGKKMPVDAGKRNDGNILLISRGDAAPQAKFLGKLELDAEKARALARGETFRAYVSHFATCPNAKSHRKR